MEEEARLERERHEKERLLALKNKEKREQSAVASSEVKQKLQVRYTISSTKKQRAVRVWGHKKKPVSTLF